MGAIEFSVTAKGKTVQEAYKRAVEDALYEEGNCAYNGTISTTDGFRPGPKLKSTSREDVDKWIELALDKTEKRGPALYTLYKEGEEKNTYLFAGWAAW
jgi:hypothetical protein